MSFLLEKRYADLVTPEGDVVVAYATALEWGRLRHVYAGATFYRADGTRLAVRATAVPNDLGPRFGPPIREIRFPCATGEFRLRYEPGPGPWRSRAAPPADGLDWWVERPRAVGTLVWPGESRVATGLGYADRVRLRRSLRRIGIRQLDWGRAHLADATVVYTRLRLTSGRDWRCMTRWRTDGGPPEETPILELPAGNCLPGMSIIPCRRLHSGPASELLPDARLTDRAFLRLFGGRLQDDRWLSQTGTETVPSPYGWVVHETVRPG